jgi:hypothetical protein
MTDTTYLLQCDPKAIGEIEPATGEPTINVRAYIHPDPGIEPVVTVTQARRGQWILIHEGWFRARLITAPDGQCRLLRREQPPELDKVDDMIRESLDQSAS